MCVVELGLVTALVAVINVVETALATFLSVTTLQFVAVLCINVNGALRTCYLGGWRETAARKWGWFRPWFLRAIFVGSLGGLHRVCISLSNCSCGRSLGDSSFGRHLFRCCGEPHWNQSTIFHLFPFSFLEIRLLIALQSVHMYSQCLKYPRASSAVTENMPSIRNKWISISSSS